MKCHLPNKTLFLSGIIFLLFLHQSCIVSKKYKTPKNLNSEKLYRFPTDSTDLNNIGNIDWKQFFTDTLLQNYIQQAIDSNFDIKNAIVQISIANSYLKQAKEGNTPQLNLDLQYSTQKFSQKSSTGQYLNYLNQLNSSLMLSWEADIWGKIRSMKRKEFAKYLETQEAKNTLQTEIISQIAQIYYQLISLHQKVKISEQTIKNKIKSLKINEELKISGTQNLIIVERSKAQLNNSIALKRDLEKQIQIQENALCLLLGDYPHSIILGNFNYQQLDSSYAIGIPAQLLSNRPDVKEAEYQLIQAFEMTNVSRANFYPTFTISATGGYQSNQLTNWFSPNSTFYNLIGGLAQPILNRNTIKENHRIALAQRKQAENNFRKTLITAGHEVSNALYIFQTSSKQIETKNKELESYQKISRITENLFDSGLVNAIEILNAEENALNTELEIVNQYYTKMSSLITLYKSLGGGQ
ncbi:MAG: efflux transporter outer membrane subunit [Bacteroidales bacterium]